jgi:hypothetical protein
MSEPQELLTNAANIATILTFGGPVLGGFVVWLANKFFPRINGWWKYRRLKPSDNYILVISTENNLENVKTDITKSCKGSLKKLQGLKQVEIKLPNECTKDDIDPLLENLNSIRVKMAKAGKTTVHLFYAGPVVLPMFNGAFFVNKDLVYTYQKNTRTKVYELWGPLRMNKLSR